jgi:hypothetical protein
MGEATIPFYGIPKYANKWSMRNPTLNEPMTKPIFIMVLMKNGQRSCFSIGAAFLLKIVIIPKQVKAPITEKDHLCKNGAATSVCTTPHRMNDIKVGIIHFFLPPNLRYR